MPQAAAIIVLLSISGLAYNQFPNSDKNTRKMLLRFLSLEPEMLIEDVQNIYNDVIEFNTVWDSQFAPRLKKGADFNTIMDEWVSYHMETY
jgi:hypothetical protein